MAGPGSDRARLISAGPGRPDRSPDSLLVSRLLGLTSVTAELAGAVDLPSVADAVTASSAEVLGADKASIYIRDGSGVYTLLGARNAEGADVAGWQTLPAEGRDPLSTAARTRQFVTASSREEIERRWPSLFGSDSSERSLVALPLLSEGAVVGVVGLSFPVAQDFTDADRQYLRALGDCCAQAVVRITATRRAADSARKLGFVADASAALAGSLDYEDTLRTVADLAVPDLADWCSIELVEDGTLRQVAISHVDPDRVELARRLRELYPPDMDAPTGVAAVVRTGRSELLPRIGAEVLDAAGLDDERRRVVADLQLNSAVTVALVARGRTLGALTLVYAESGRHYEPADVSFAEDLARRAAIAIDNAHLHTETLQVALRLQRAILPESFPDSRSWQVAAHYRPAGRTEVGGDFYDALTLPDGRLAVVVGDVMGRGLEAAAAMAQTRAALRAYAAIDPEPEAVLGRLDRMFIGLELPELVTVIYAVIDPASGRARMISAGHLPPVFIAADGAARLVEHPPSPPLGLGGEGRPVTTVAFGCCDTLLLYTDGLVERRGENLDDGLARLASAAPDLCGGLSDRRLAGLADRLRHAGHDDDLTLLAVRLLGA